VRRVAGIVFALLVLAAPAPAAETRYSLANGCFRAAGVPGAEAVRMQATALGRYLLYRPDGRYVASTGVTAAPSPAADWKVEEAGDTFTLTPGSGPARTGVRFTPATGCASFPEAPLNATGTPSRGALPYGRVGGLVDGHMHWMTFEYFGGNFHCGRPWAPYGIAAALPDCATIEGPAGVGAVFQNFLNYGAPTFPHDTRGYPQLTSWGATNLTYEGTYWRWVQRAWMAGLRLMVMSVNENRVLCSLQPVKKTSCDEMDTVRRGLDDIRRLQDYVDAQAGGPGRGFFQIVTDPYQAREVINAGRMAVVLEIEVSEPFGCRNLNAPTCDAAKADRELDDLYKRGVRSALLLNKVDNPLAGVRFDSGEQGVLINGANLLSAGSFWSAKTCTGPLRDNTITGALSPGMAGLLASIGITNPVLPVYPPAPHCNTRGLTDLGAHVVNRMMDKHMIVNPDHMSQAGVDGTLSLLERRGYSGVISPHGWMDPGNWPRIWKLGGLAWPGHSRADAYVAEWKALRPASTPYAFGWGYGADLGGLSDQPAARAGLTYPFKGIDGAVTFERQKTGERTFDYTTEGVATYGQYADWFADLRDAGGAQLAQDLWDGAEAYLEMWERAEGVKTPSCTRAALSARRLGAGWKTLLRTAGQPTTRDGALWSWCGTDTATLSSAGRVQLLATTAPGRSAGGVKVGARMAGTGVRIKRSGRRAWVYDVRGGRVRAAGVTTRAFASRRMALRTALAKTRAAKAPAPRAFAARAAAASYAGRPLAGAGNPRLDDALALFCSLA
jgi:microsomal dipeptidase-like Zn-dependent dipeptidase